MQILHTVLCTFPKALPWRICLTIKGFFRWWLNPLFLWPSCVIQGWYCKEKLDASHSFGVKRLSDLPCFPSSTEKAHLIYNYMLFPKGETFSEHVSAKSYSLFTNISSFHIFSNPLHPNINVHILQLFSRHFLRCQHGEFV